MSWFNDITGQTFAGEKTLAGALGEFNQSNFDVGGTVAYIRQLQQHTPFAVPEDTLIRAAAIYGNTHRDLAQSGYTEGSNYRDIALRNVADAIRLQTGDAQLSQDFYNKWSTWSDVGRGEGQARTEATQKKDDGFGDLGTIAAIAGLVTGGLSLVGALGSAATSAATAGAGWISAEGGAAYLGGLAADAATGSIFSGLGTAANIVKSGVSVASSVNTLTSSKPTTNAPQQRQTGSATPTPSNLLNVYPIMANPLYTKDNMTSNQSAAPAQIGSTPPPPNSGARIMGMAPDAVVLLALAAAVVYAFMEGE